MRWVNFNISVPLSDLMFGTRETEAAWQVARERRTSAPASPGTSGRGASGPQAAETDKDDEALPLRVGK